VTAHATDRPGVLANLPLRTRLVAGFVVAMLVLLTVAGGFVYWRVEYALDRGLDTELARATTTISPLVGGDGRVATPGSADATGTTWQVLDAQAHVLDSGGGAPSAPMVGPAVLADVGSGPLVTELGDLLPVADRPYRIHVTALAGSPRYLLVGLRRDHRDEALRELVVQMLLAGLGALLVASLVGDLLARAALRPVERYRRRAAEIAGGAGGLRLDVPDRDDEVTRLGHTLNEMLAALERSLEHERRFVNDASHELRTPLTLLQSRLQLARRRSRDAAEHEAILDELAVDVRRLVDLADQLLAIGGRGQGVAGECDATRVVGALVEQRRLALPDHAHDLVVDLPAGPVPVAVDAVALERLATNLLDNATRHGAPPVQLRLGAHDPWVRLEVRDAGPGIGPDLLATATGRFTRSAEARSRQGSGLGLALVDQLVVAAGGELRLCHDGTHWTAGQPTPVPCDHDDAMTVTVLLPVVRVGTAPPPPR